MKKITMIILAAKGLRLIGGSLRLTMGGLGLALALMTLYEEYRRRQAGTIK